MTLLEMVLRKKYERDEHDKFWIDSKIKDTFEKIALFNDPLYNIYVTENYELVDHRLDDKWANSFGNPDMNVAAVLHIGEFWVAVCSNYMFEVNNLIMIHLGWNLVPEKYYLQEVEVA